MAMSEVSGYSQLSSHSSDTVSWLDDPDILPFLQGKLLLLDHYDRWMGIINKTPGETTVTAAVALRNLKKLAEDALRLAFASGSMVDVHHLNLVDAHSLDHAIHHFRGQPVKPFLRALRQTN